MYKILIVDDITENLIILSQILSDNFGDIRIFTSEDVRTGILTALSELPDIIITDWDMPAKSGIEFIKFLKSNETTKEIPVIIATGIMTSSENLKEALDIGAVDYLKKPFDEIELYARVKSALKLSEYYKKIIENKNYDLSILALNITRNRKLIENLRLSLKAPDNKKNFEGKPEEISSLLNEIEENMKKNSWKSFNKSLRNSHNDFIKKLLEIHPNLTNSELKLSNLIYLGLSCKKISEVLFQTPESVRVARSRLRKKLNLSPDRNTEIYLKSI